MSPPPDPTAGWPDLAGRMIRDADGRRHVLPVRVYFEDTDFSGLVYHATYLRWCERGRSDFLRLMGNDHQALIAGGEGREPAAFVVRRMSVEFLRPARLDDALVVVIARLRVGASRVEMEQYISSGNERLLQAGVRLACVRIDSFLPVRLPRSVRGLLADRSSGRQTDE